MAYGGTALQTRRWGPRFESEQSSVHSGSLRRVGGQLTAFPGDVSESKKARVLLLVSLPQGTL